MITRTKKPIYDISDIEHRYYNRTTSHKADPPKANHPTPYAPSTLVRVAKHTHNIMQSYRDILASTTVAWYQDRIHPSPSIETTIQDPNGPSVSIYQQLNPRLKAELLHIHTHPRKWTNHTAHFHGPIHRRNGASDVRGRNRDVGGLLSQGG